MSTDWRALCEELADGLASTGEAASGTYKALLDRARAALAAEPVADEAMPPRVGHILRLAEIIREVDGNHDKGAAALAEAILSHPRARAALAAEADGPAVPEGREPASVVGEPSDEDLLELTEDWPATTGPRHDLSGCPEVPLYSVFADELLEYARAVLARFGHQPAPVPVAEFDCPACEDVPKQGNQPCAVCGRSAPPAAGEVAELALKELERTVVLLMPVTGHKRIKRFNTIRAALKRLQELENKGDLSPAPAPAEGEVAELVAELRRFRSVSCRRAADMLEQCQAALVPVASDTRYEFSVVDEDYTEQAGGSAPTYAQALSEGQHYLAQYQQDGPHALELRRVEVLPPDALPLPQGEVE